MKYTWPSGEIDLATSAAAKSSFPTTDLKWGKCTLTTFVLYILYSNNVHINTLSFIKYVIWFFY